MDRFNAFIDLVVSLIIQPLITLLFALALAYFVWGMAQFILNAADSEGRERGKRALLWGIVGIFIMTAVIGILRITLGTFAPGEVNF